MMHRLWTSGLLAVLALVVTEQPVAFADDPATGAKSEAPPLKIVSRGIGRQFIDNSGKVSGPLADQGFKTATSLAYQVQVLDNNGKPVRMASAGETFRLGQRFRLMVETDSDLYLYVLHEGPTGDRTVLVPDTRFGDQPLLARKGTKTYVPAEDATEPNSFVFEPPAGTDKLLVLASPEPLKAADVVKNWKQLTTAQTELRTRMAFSAAALKTDEGTMHVVGSKNADERPKVFLEIALTSQ